LFGIGLQTGAPSMLTSTAAPVLKNTTGGSAATPFTFCGLMVLAS
jgi:hypothetical protein